MASVVLQTSFLGDMVLTTPLLARVAEAGPVHVVATPANASLLANHPAVTSVLVYDKRGADRGWRGLQRMAARVRALGADTAYLAQGSVRTAVVATLAGIPRRVGFASSAGKWLYTHRVPYVRSWHHAERLWSLASAESGSPERMPSGSRPALYPGPSEAAAVDALFAEHGVQPQHRLVAFAPGSVWATKRWPGFDALAAHLAASDTSHETRIVVLGGPDDRTLATHIAEAAASQGPERHAVIDATGRLSLLASAALLARVSLLVSNDSAPLHLASAMNTPTVALFGPTVPGMGFGPLSERHRVLGVDTLGCRPCGAHGAKRCPLGHWRCMRDLSVAAVIDPITELVQLRSNDD